MIIQSQVSIKNWDKKQLIKVIRKCNRSLLQSASAITKCDWSLLQSASGITKCNSYYKWDVTDDNNFARFTLELLHVNKNVRKLKQVEADMESATYNGFQHHFPD